MRAEMSRVFELRVCVANSFICIVRSRGLIKHPRKLKFSAVLNFKGAKNETVRWSGSFFGQV